MENLDDKGSLDAFPEAKEQTEQKIQVPAVGQVIAQDGHTKRVLTEIDTGVLYVAEDQVSVLVNL